MNKYFSDIKVWAKSLTISCPMEDAKADCPFKDLRALPLPERLSAIDEMSSVRLVMIVKHHSNCLQLREQ